MLTYGDWPSRESANVERKTQRKRQVQHTKDRRKWQGPIHKAVSKAIKCRLLIRSPICENCRKKCKTVGHHRDYNYPLEVIWLCHKCHRTEHMLKKE